MVIGFSDGITRRWKPAAIAAGALVLTAAVGAWAGQAAAPGERGKPPAGRVVHVGQATLVVPREWRARPADTAEETVFAPSPGAGERVIVTLAPADDRSLVPTAMRNLVRGLGNGPRETRFAGHPAWRYTRLRGRDGATFDVTVVPTSAGMLSVACASPAPQADCTPTIESISLRGASSYTPSPDLALRLRLPGVFAALDRERVSARAALRRAATNTRQTRLALSLEHAHLAAAAALRPVAGGEGAALPGRLSDTASAYAALAEAASAGSPARYRAAARSVRTAEADLAAATDRFLRTPAPVAAVASPTRGSSKAPAGQGGLSPATIMLLIAGLVVLSLAVPRLLALRGRRRSPERPPAPVKIGADPPPPAPVRPVRPPSDPSARWDALPPALGSPTPLEPAWSPSDQPPRATPGAGHDRRRADSGGPHPRSAP